MKQTLTPTAPARLRRTVLQRAVGALACAGSLGLTGCNTAPVQELRQRIASPSQAPALLPDIRKDLEPSPTRGAAPAEAAKAATAASAPAGMPQPAEPLVANLEPSAVQGPVSAAEAAGTAPRKEARFDLNVAGVSAAAVFQAVAHDTRLSVLVDPTIKGSYTVSLKDVTVREALEALQELYGFEYKVVGRKLVVQPPEPQTRVFRVNYPVINRSGRTEVRVTSSTLGPTGAPGSGASGSTGASAPGAQGQTPGGSAQESSRVSTTLRNDVWGEIEASVKLLVPEKDGNRVVVSPQTGSIVVRAMPASLRAVERYLESARLQVERQVMIEAKIIEVTLNNSNTTGINWAAFRNALNSRLSAGVVRPGAQLSPTGQLVAGAVSALPGGSLAATAADAIGGGLFGLAFQTSNFAAVLSFLETQGTLQVLSSPRIATLNNQKAVLKVGSDDFFVTNISTTTSSTGNSSTTSPTISVQPFFSGISLDVTPQIDDTGQIILHVHPQVTMVKERAKVLNLGSLGNFTLPLASSSVNESDSIVRVSDGNIFAIGGLMRQEQNDERSGVPGTADTVLRHFLGQSARTSSKQELVILLKPSVISALDGTDGLRASALTNLMNWLDGSAPPP